MKLLKPTTIQSKGVPKMLTKQNIHKAYLLVSAIVVLHGTILAMSWQGHFDFVAFRYYTALSNWLVVISFFAMLILYNKLGKFRSYLSVSAIIGIMITGLVYNLVLIPNVEYISLATYSNFITYLVSPILALINYFVFEEKGKLAIKHIWVGMAQRKNKEATAFAIASPIVMAEIYSGTKLLMSTIRLIEPSPRTAQPPMPCIPVLCF
ncbi:MAG: hypothetical protein FWC13_04165 [Oscillospiraceae bacterium]|nr:hypothetical protein [Oscillospiraceae bacterium]